MSQQELLIAAVRVLDKAGVGCMLTGSLVSSLQGEPRATHDADLVIEVAAAAVDRLVEAFPGPRYHLDATAARSALATSGMFGLLDSESGDEIDFWALTDSAFDLSRFERRVAAPVFGERLFVSTPEDTILQKLKWAAASGGSERQVRDATGVYEVQAGALDETYLDEWAARLGVADLLARVRADAGS